MCKGVITWSKCKGRYYGACKRDNLACKGYSLLREDRIETKVIAELRNIKNPDLALKNLEDKLQSSDKRGIASHRMEVIKALKTQINKLHSMDNMLYEDKLAGEITKQKYQSKHQEFEEKIAELRNRLNLLRTAELGEEADSPESLDKNPLVNFYLKSTPYNKRIIIKSFTKLENRIYVLK